MPTAPGRQRVPRGDPPRRGTEVWRCGGGPTSFRRPSTARARSWSLVTTGVAVTRPGVPVDNCSAFHRTSSSRREPHLAVRRDNSRGPPGRRHPSLKWENTTSAIDDIPSPSRAQHGPRCASASRGHRSAKLQMLWKTPGRPVVTYRPRIAYRYELVTTEDAAGGTHVGYTDATGVVQHGFRSGRPPTERGAHRGMSYEAWARAIAPGPRTPPAGPAVRPPSPTRDQ
jgi:hypothetical protein